MRAYDMKIIVSGNVRMVILISFCLAFISCASVNPHKIDVTIKPEAPVMKKTSFDQTLMQLGKMTQIYGTDKMDIMCRDISDRTGTSEATGGEIPFEITEMVKTSLNSIGGNVVYIPYNPHSLIILREAQYSNFANKKIPHVIITGGITEFDRGLELRGDNTNISIETGSIDGTPDWFGGDTIGIDMGKQNLRSVSRITLDFNMLDFQANSGIARMQTVNTIQVQKALAESELAFTLFGPTFGLKGNVKKIQGRHAAIRMLVQLSMVQIVGKFFDLPYWRILPDAEPDPVVVDIVTTDFCNMNEQSKSIKVQELLFIHGYDVPISKTFDKQAQIALHKFDPKYTLGNSVDAETFLKLYFSVPVTNNALKRRYKFNQRLNDFLASLNQEKSRIPEILEQEQKTEKPSKKPRDNTVEDETFNRIIILLDNKDKAELFKHYKAKTTYMH